MLKIALVGYGYWGPNLVRNFNSLSECTVEMVCDLDHDRLTHLKQLYPHVKTTMHFDRVLKNKEIDAIAVATPVHKHHELAKLSLLAGKHTFIEKPMASSVAECEDLINLTQQIKLTLMVGHTFVHTAAVRKIKEFIKTNYLGEILYISCQRLNLGLFQKDINVAWDLAPHDISIINFLMDETPVSINCQGKAHINPGIEDVTNISLHYANKCFATIHSSWLNPNKIRTMTIVGSQKMLIYDDTEPLEKIKIYDQRVESPPHYDTFAEWQYSYHYGDMHAPYLKQEEPLRTQCQHFVDCIMNGTKPVSGYEEGLQVVRILEAASESLRRGGAKVEISDASLSNPEEIFMQIYKKAV